MRTRGASFPRIFLRLAAGAALAATYGCGSSDRGTITGKLLRKDGTPLVDARVVATSQDGQSAYGTTNDRGEFSLGAGRDTKGVPPGDYQLIVIEDLGDPDNRRRPTISAKYRKAETSAISVSVAAGKKVELNLTLDPP